jgi:uncharacterized protein
METVLITGGTGLVGTALTKELTAKGYSVIILSRKAHQSSKRSLVQYALWNVEQQTIDRDAVQKADYIIHLAGANVGERHWTESRKRAIRESRTRGGDLLVKALRDYPNKVKAVVSASAIGWYGPDPQVPNPKPFTESDPSHSSFLGITCQQWEDSIKPVMEMGKRLVILRTAIVLSKEGGALKEFERPLKFGMATVLGSGRQVVSWIHIADLVNIYITALENERWQGVHNAVAPTPTTNKELVLTMAKERGKFHVQARVPVPVLELTLGEMSTEVLKSATVSNKKLEQAGYQYFFPNINVALHNLYKKAS